MARTLKLLPRAAAERARARKRRASPTAQPQRISERRSSLTRSSSPPKTNKGRKGARRVSPPSSKKKAPLTNNNDTELDAEEYSIEEIKGVRWNGNKLEFHCKWENYAPRFNSWEPLAYIVDLSLCLEYMDEKEHEDTEVFHIFIALQHHTTRYLSGDDNFIFKHQREFLLKRFGDYIYSCYNDQLNLKDNVDAHDVELEKLNHALRIRQERDDECSVVIMVQNSTTFTMPPSIYGIKAPVADPTPFDLTGLSISMLPLASDDENALLADTDFEHAFDDVQAENEERQQAEEAALKNTVVVKYTLWLERRSYAWVLRPADFEIVPAETRICKMEGTPVKLTEAFEDYKMMGELVAMETYAYLGRREVVRDDDETSARHFFGGTEEWVLDRSKAEDGSKFIKHSCDPNCYVKVDVKEGTIEVWTKKELMPGEDLTLDHFNDKEGKASPEKVAEYKDKGRDFVLCHCEADNCRVILWEEKLFGEDTKFSDDKAKKLNARVPRSFKGRCFNTD